MRLWKLFVLLAGVAGIVGFFSPFLEYRSTDGKLTNDASAFQIARDVDTTGDLATQAEKLGLPHDDAKRLGRALNEGIDAYRGMVLAYYAPAALLFLFGIVLVARDRMGRLAGLVVIVLGGACCAVFALFFRANQTSHDTSATLGLGLYLLGGGGLGAVLAGLGALVSPDRGPLA